MNIVEVDKIVKKFGNLTASNNINFNVKEGIIYGLLGPNGAGKTTMIRMLTNIYIPDSGTIKIFGEAININTLNRMSYLPEERGLYKKLKVIDQLVYFARLKGMSRKDAENRAKEWLIKLDAADWKDKKIQELSKGMQQKVQFISTVLHDPEFLILDEPFSGFDPVNAEMFQSILIDLKKSGKTIILSTHLMHQAEKLCDEIGLINKGNMIINGTVREVKKQYGKNNIVCEFEGDSSFINEINEIQIIEKGSHFVEFKIDSKEIDTNAILQKFVDNSKVIKFEIVEPSLNEIFINAVNPGEIVNG